MAIDFRCNLFTPEAIGKWWYGQPEFLRLIKWWQMEDRVKGVPVVDFIAMMDAAGLDKNRAKTRDPEMRQVKKDNQ